MQTESTVLTRDIERTGRVAILRVVDFEAIAKRHADGKVPIEELQNGGDFVVEITPNGRDAKPVRHKVAGVDAGHAFVAGFEAAIAIKKKGPRKPRAPKAPKGDKPAKK